MSTYHGQEGLEEARVKRMELGKRPAVETGVQGRVYPKDCVGPWEVLQHTSAAEWREHMTTLQETGVMIQFWMWYGTIMETVEERFIHIAGYGGWYDDLEDGKAGSECAGEELWLQLGQMLFDREKWRFSK